MKKKYNKPLTTTTMVRQQSCFCSSIMSAPSKVKAEEHKTGFDNTKEENPDEYTFSTDWH